MAEFQGNRKRRTREHVIADLSVNHVERFVFRAGHTSQRTSHDYGTDLMVKTYDPRGQVEAGYLFFQLKASDKTVYVDTGKSVSVAVDRRDLDVWIDEIYPVILVMYDARKDRAYWMHVQEELELVGGVDALKMSVSKNVRLKTGNRISIRAISRFAAIKSEITARRKGPLKQ